MCLTVVQILCDVKDYLLSWVGGTRTRLSANHPTYLLPDGNFLPFQHILRTHTACFVPCFAFASDRSDFVVKISVSASAVKYLTLEP